VAKSIKPISPTAIQDSVLKFVPSAPNDLADAAQYKKDAALEPNS
jgi:hypothetical protein